MFRRLADEDSVRSIEELIEMTIELVFIEALEWFRVVFTVVGESFDSEFRCFGLRVTLVDERDSVLHREIEDWGNEVRCIHVQMVSFLVFRHSNSLCIREFL